MFSTSQIEILEDLYYSSDYEYFVCYTKTSTSSSSSPDFYVVLFDDGSSSGYNSFSIDGDCRVYSIYTNTGSSSNTTSRITYSDYDSTDLTVSSYEYVSSNLEDYEYLNLLSVESINDAFSVANFYLLLAVLFILVVDFVYDVLRRWFP